MRRSRVATLGSIALAAAVACACGGPQAGGGGEGGRARDFALRDVDGRTVRLSDHLGKDVVVIAFWATWCAPCITEHPHLERIYRAYQQQGFVVLAVSMDGPESIAEVAPHVRRYGLTFPVLLDEETRVVGTLNPKRAAPYTLVIARDGTIAYTHEGYSPGDEITLEDKVKALLAAPAGS
jgi:peroxiredoxin